MGLTIHYNGEFRKNASLSEMIEEVKDIAEIYNWNYHIFEKEFPKNSLGKKTFDGNIYGIIFSPPKCEGVSLCFLSNRKIGNPAMLQDWLKSKNKKDKRLIYGNFTKTQYAGWKTHKIIIDLFRYLNKKYFQNLFLIDEGNYWQSNNVELLKYTFKEWGALIDGFADTLSKIKRKGGETTEGLIIRSAKKLHSKRKK